MKIKKILLLYTAILITIITGCNKNTNKINGISDEFNKDINAYIQLVKEDIKNKTDNSIMEKANSKGSKLRDKYWVLRDENKLNDKEKKILEILEDSSFIRLENFLSLDGTKAEYKDEIDQKALNKLNEIYSMK